MGQNWYEGKKTKLSGRVVSSNGLHASPYIVVKEVGDAAVVGIKEEAT